jgi:hypothetical protein
MTRKLILAAILSLTAAASAQSADSLIKSAIAAANTNASNAYAYNFHENWATVSNDMTAQFPVTKSIQYDVTFIDTFPFRRKVGIDGYPLNDASIAIENARYEKAFADIRAMTPAERTKALEDQDALLFDPAVLASNYTCTITGHKTIDKRPSTVVDCAVNKHPLTHAAKSDFLPARLTFWIDVEHPFFHRTRMVLADNAGEYGPDTVVTIQWQLDGDVWHHTSTQIDFKNTKDHPYGGEIVDSFSNFKKFRSETTFVTRAKIAIPAPKSPH